MDIPVSKLVSFLLKWSDHLFKLAPWIRTLLLFLTFTHVRELAFCVSINVNLSGERDDPGSVLECFFFNFTNKSCWPRWPTGTELTCLRTLFVLVMQIHVMFVVTVTTISVLGSRNWEKIRLDSGASTHFSAMINSCSSIRVKTKQMCAFSCSRWKIMLGLWSLGPQFWS